MANALYWGGAIGGEQYGYAGQAYPWGTPYATILANYIAGAGGGKKPTIVDFGAIFREADGVTMDAFPSSLCDRVIADGLIPHITWMSTQRGGGPTQTDFTNAMITAGTYDTYITQWATDAKNWGHPLFLRYDHEMNGSWFNWGVGANGNTAASYVAMWQHVHDIFVSVGATNVSWIWCVNYDPSLPGSYFYVDYSTLYPGDTYVDWVGMDGYNYGSIRGNPWRTFTTIYDASYNALVGIVGATKPFSIDEIGCGEPAGGDKAAWITDAYNQIVDNYPRFRMVGWYDFVDSFLTYIETSTPSRDAYASAVADPHFLAGGSAYTSLPFEQVPLPVIPGVLRSNTFEGGTDGAAITPTNSDGPSGDGFQSVSSLWKYSLDPGVMSARYVNPGGVAQVMDWLALGSLTGDVFLRLYFKILANPNVAALPLFRTQDGTPTRCSVLKLSTGRLLVATNSANANLTFGTVPVALMKMVRVEVRINPSTTLGQVEWRLYNNPDAPISAFDDTNGSVDSNLALTANIDAVRWGYIDGTAADPLTFYCKYAAISTDGWIGPAAPLASPSRISQPHAGHFGSF